MSNFTLEELLQLPPLEAMLIAYNEEHGTQLNPRFVFVEQIVSSAGRNLTVKVTSRGDLSNKDTQRFSGSALITIRRLDLAELFTQPFIIDYAEAISSIDVGNNIYSKTGVVFDSADFVPDVITEENNVVRAGENSLRWYGEMTIVKA